MKMAMWLQCDLECRQEVPEAIILAEDGPMVDSLAPIDELSFLTHADVAHVHVTFRSSISSHHFLSH